MRVLLRNDVQGIGQRGDLVSVSDGYARNFLLPNGLALRATEGMEGQAASMRRARDLRHARSDEAARVVAQVLDGVNFTIPARASATGRLFGSVSAHDIARVVREQKGVEIDEAAVGLEEPIKAIGSVEVPVQLYGDVTAHISVEVTPAT